MSGVDFVKIDTQGTARGKLIERDDFLKDCIELHLSVESAAEKYFGANVINCMGMSNLDLSFRPYSVLARNSDDFYPNRENGFKIHIMQNLFNSVFHRNLFWCDFDMWWTSHFNAKQSSVLRAVSGGPIYISDKVGETSCEYVFPLIDENGNVLKCADSAVPTEDCLFSDGSNGVLKAYNTLGDEGVVAVFNLADENQEICVTPADFNAEGRYAAYAYFDRTLWKNGTVRITLKPNEAEVINFYKVREESIRFGDKTKYISVATKRGKFKRIEEVAEENSLLLKE